MNPAGVYDYDAVKAIRPQLDEPERVADILSQMQAILDNTADFDRSYRTEVQLYKALAALKCNIIPAALISNQKEALARLRCIMRDIDYSFYKTFDMDVDDVRTVYADCAFHLIPREDEPSVCLMRDWIYLPSA